MLSLSSELEGINKSVKSRRHSEVYLEAGEIKNITTKKT